MKWQCDICDIKSYFFTSHIYHLNLHDNMMIKYNNNNNKWTCTLCDQTFDLEQLRNHINRSRYIYESHESHNSSFCEIGTAIDNKNNITQQYLDQLYS